MRRSPKPAIVAGLIALAGGHARPVAAHGDDSASFRPGGRPALQTPIRMQRGGYCPGDYGRYRFESAWRSPRLRSIYDWSATASCPNWAGFAPIDGIRMPDHERVEVDSVLLPSIVIESSPDSRIPLPPAPYENLVYVDGRHRTIVQRVPMDDGWSLLSEGRAEAAMLAFARDGRADSRNASFKLGHALAAVMIGDEGRVVWALRAAVRASADEIRDVPLDRSLRRLMHDEIDARRVAAETRSNPTDEWFVVATLSYVLGDDESARVAVASAVGHGDRAESTRALAQAARAAVRSRDGTDDAGGATAECGALARGSEPDRRHNR